MSLLSIARRVLHALDIALTVSGPYFLHMAAICAIGIGLLYPGLSLANLPLITIAILLQTPFWLWATGFVVIVYASLAIAIPVGLYFYFVAPAKETDLNDQQDGKSLDPGQMCD